MAALNRSGIFALRLFGNNARGLSTTSKWLAVDSTASSGGGVTKKNEVPSHEIEPAFPRSKQMEKLIEVEGAVDITAISVSTLKCCRYLLTPCVSTVCFNLLEYLSYRVFENFDLFFHK